ncbi:hypothetical protein C2845_PM11G08620 [Panicum miliaceum]|uniref:Uncharacterized protein n=1 Tax=Panicum miliaceum TaxID=4540 RepID=A0A3L6RWQ9_PANMI|nr:hypothetical protein C2845_PM11G08620 [Panicum miliaceum]
MSTGSSSAALPRNREGSKRRVREDEQVGPEHDGVHASVPEAVSAEPVEGVKQMTTNLKQVIIGSQSLGGGAREKISGLDSYMESSDNSESIHPTTEGVERPSMHERRALANLMKDGSTGEKKHALKGAAKDIDKPKRSKKIINPSILESVKALKEQGLDDGGVLNRVGQTDRWLVGAAGNGPEWLLHVVGTARAEEAARLILVLWKAWFVRNEWTHAGRWIGGEASVKFLTNYWESLTGGEAACRFG